MNLNYKQKKYIKVGIIVLALIAAIASYQYYGINLGLDLEGGSHIVLQAQPTEDREVTSDVMSGIREILERRVNELGLAEAVIQTVPERNQIIIELPAVEDPHDAIDIIGRTAVLTIQNEQGEVLMSGEHISNAQARARGAGAVIQFSLDREGANQFEQITRQYLGRNIGFFLDEEQLTMGRVNDVIRDSGEITGFSTVSEAQDIAVLIREGALPVPLTIEESRYIGPTLGRIALEDSIRAGLIGLLLVCLYMIFYYKFPGVLIAIVLSIYGVLFLGTLAGFRATLTLPGIAGLILSIGIAADANIIIFERIKDERKNGKTLKTAIDAGFKRAYTAIVDAELTTLMTALILAYFTTGAVRGFAVTLSIGIVINLFTVFFVTNTIIGLFTNTALLKNEKSFGAQRR